MDEQLNPLDRDHSLSVVLPGGLENTATVHGSKPVMDFLVTLCASYHLNPSDYTVEFLSHNKNNIRFKPNSPVGSLEAEKIVFKPKGMEEKIKRPYMPEPSVRLLINYNKSHKAVLRVNPKVPLEMLLPAVCEKCEFQVETTVLLRGSQSTEPLDLSKSLSDHGLREVFAKDAAAEHLNRSRTPEKVVTPTEVPSSPPLQEVPKKEKKQKENSGFLSLFRRHKKKPLTDAAGSAQASPGLKVGVSGNIQTVSSSSSNTLTADTSKKRRAPQPPMGVSQSVPNNLSTCHLRGAQRSADSTLRSTKRRAPPPPCANNHEGHPEVKGIVNSSCTLEDLRESDESGSITLSLSSSSSPHPSRSRSSSSFSRLHDAADQYLPSFRGKDLADARSALAKVLTSSISKGALVKRLKNSATLPRYNNSSTFVSVSHGRTENGGVSPELEPVLATNLPIEPDWEDPVERRVLTTFRVVPPMKQKSTDAETTLNVPEKEMVEEAIYEVLKDQTEAEEELTCLDGSGVESSSQEVSSLPNCLPVLQKMDCQSSVESEVGDTLEREEDEEPGGQEDVLEDEEEPEREEEKEPKIQEDIPEREDEEEPQREEEEPKKEQGVPESEDEEEPQRHDTPERGEEEEEEPEEESEATSEAVQAEEFSTEGQKFSMDLSDILQIPSQDWAGAGSDNYSTYAEDSEFDEDDDEEYFFPPPPPPVFLEDLEVLDEAKEATTSSLPSNRPTEASDDDPEPSALPYLSAAAPQSAETSSPAPSRFAQAVAIAVQRSRIMNHGKSSSAQASNGPDSSQQTSAWSIYQFGA